MPEIPASIRLPNTEAFRPQSLWETVQAFNQRLRSGNLENYRPAPLGFPQLDACLGGGLRAEDLSQAEKCLRRLATVAHRHFGHDFAKWPGAGAAGGLGFGLLAFLGAKSEPGFELFARHAKLDRHLRAADLVITGEGAIDRSTLMGKGTGEIAQRCRARKIPCLALAGYLAPDIRRNKLFHEVRALTDLTTVRQAKTKPADWLERLAELVARNFKTGRAMA